MIWVYELSVAFIWLDQGQNESEAVLSCLAQHAEDRTGHSNGNDHLNQKPYAPVVVCVTIKERCRRSQREELEREKPRLVGVGTDRLPGGVRNSQSRLSTPGHDLKQ